MEDIIDKVSPLRSTHTALLQNSKCTQKQMGKSPPTMKNIQLLNIGQSDWVTHWPIKKTEENNVLYEAEFYQRHSAAERLTLG